MKRILFILVSMFFVASFAYAEVKPGEIPERIELKEDLGGRLDGAAWSSDEMRGRVFVLFYVDPDEKDLNNDASEALKKENFPDEKYQSVAIINMAATWLPNFAISSSLKKKQKQYPRTTYVRDYKKALVEKWGLSDDTSDVLAFDREGRLIFRKDGKLGAGDIEKLLKVVRDHL